MEDLSTEALFGGMVGKNVVVTGGSSGIGLMISAAFVQAGCNVYIFSRRPDHAAAAALTSKGPGRCVSLVCDVANDAQISEVVKLIGERCPEGLHVLVNNSGAVWAATFEETSKSSFDKLMNVNVTGLFMVTQKFTPLLTRAATAQDPARVINIASYVTCERVWERVE
jgi:NAD(P)-dependent dehydrogenase (short-subunit alcohol dehydrogenase family)